MAENYLQDLSNSSVTTAKAFTKGTFSAVLILAIPVIEISFLAWATVQLIKLPRTIMSRGE